MDGLAFRAAALAALLAVAGAVSATAEATPAGLVSGNGRLTVTVDAFGGIRSCRWPSPGYHDQLGAAPTADGPPGPHTALAWALTVAHETRWLSSPPWRTTQRYLDDESMIAETRYMWPEGEGEVMETVFVHPEQDLLVTRIETEQVADLLKVAWYADFSPCTRLIPELPFADWALDGLNDFAAFQDAVSGTIYHFRPDGPSTRDWAWAKKLAGENTKTAAWDAFEGGVWIGTMSPDSVSGMNCGRGGDPAALLSRSGTAERAAIGDCASALTIRCGGEGDTRHATVFVAFGASREEVDDTLAYAMAQGYDALFEETERYWADWLASARLPATDDARLLSQSKRCLLALVAALDRGTGAAVRASAAHPSLALAWTRHSPWIAQALDLAGSGEQAEKLLLFHAGTAREESARGKPAGSFPAAVYANGVEALPHLVLDVEAVAWMLYALERHVAFLPQAEREALLGQVWEMVDRSADFLAGWVDGRTGIPLYSFRETVLRDVQDAQLFVNADMGMRSALELAAVQGEERPAWEACRESWEPLFRQYMFSAEGQWNLKHPLSVWRTGRLPADDPRWDTAARMELAQLDSAEGVQAARTILDLAEFLRERPDLLDIHRGALLEKLESVMSAPGSANTTDALHAALCFDAAVMLAALGAGQ
jgi:hypothetical protein